MTLRPYALAALLALAVGTGCTIDLQHDLTEQDANEIYVLLSKNGISATKMKEEGGNELRFRIQVPKADTAQAAELLRAYSLPRPMEKGLNHFAKGGMVPTATEERAMLLKALGGEVSNALNQIDGVLEARVIVMIPENNDLAQPENKPEPSASVFIKYRPGLKNDSPIKREDVQQFVSTAVPEAQAGVGDGAADAGAGARRRGGPGEPPAGRVRHAHDGLQREPVPDDGGRGRDGHPGRHRPGGVADAPGRWCRSRRGPGP
ncbi:hypothetical protein ACN28I_44535 [Archangium gephyra]|uniref:hypothetical protein n=1 Tax=Archangium gephyra TaxID=48 RepID=UPI003B7BE9DB